MSTASNTVLVVDDDADIREAVQDILSFEGYAVAQAANGQEALALLSGPHALRPCLILLDLMMPVMDGEEFVGRLQQEQRLAELPIILVTASGRAQLPGVRAILKKPFDMDVLLSAVGEHRH
ncbi:response regulator [Myxococcus sp. SDU36]|uniref:response regulator n=1 Tax=unclassified Myxococcus TaxID=2648731 RepID=UPI00159549C9|nr:response regulator [Myxococcus sp. SDU36]NVJ02779.1 response regulator [Myxococcus sp. AM009]WIG93813.1 response regulator [Myxococcus sp. SDU36]